jgi:hypothetical protein
MPLRLQGIEDGRIEPSWDDIVSPRSLQLAADFLVSRIIPSRRQNLARQWVHFGHEQVEMELRSGSIMSWFFMADEHHTVGVELKLGGQFCEGFGLLLGADVAFRR